MNSSQSQASSPTDSERRRHPSRICDSELGLILANSGHGHRDSKERAPLSDRSSTRTSLAAQAKEKGECSSGIGGLEGPNGRNVELKQDIVHAHGRSMLSSQSCGHNNRPGPSTTSVQGIEYEEEIGLTELAVPPRMRTKEVLRAAANESSETDLEQPKGYSENGAVSESHEFSGRATLLYKLAYLIFFAFAGLLARLGVEWLSFYPGQPVTISSLWANFGGSLFMGFLSEDQRLFQEEWGEQNHSSDEFASSNSSGSDGSGQKEKHNKIKKTIPLFIGLSTGFCGSFTVFSTFMRDIFIAITNNNPVPFTHFMFDLASGPLASNHSRSPGYSISAALAVVILTVFVSLGALVLGQHIAQALDRITPTLSFRFIRRVIDPLAVILAISSWILVITLCILPEHQIWRGELLFALAFAPVGCILRWYTSIKLNRLVPSFPLGTFSVNILGVVILGVCYDLQRVPLKSADALPGGGVIGCQVLQGIIDGFCGCQYGALSVIAGGCAVIIIMGSVDWSIGWQIPACAT